MCSRKWRPPLKIATTSARSREKSRRASSKHPAPSSIPTRRNAGNSSARANRERKALRIARDEKVLEETGIRKLRAQTVFTTPNCYPPKNFSQSEIDDPDFREVIDPKHCYICKQPYSEIHHFYDQLCPECAEHNFAKRSETADLTGKVALLTGGRVKIGYQAGIKLLRAGAHLIVTTRFPRDAAKRFSEET